MNRAFYGDIHGCIDELKELYNKVERTHPGIEHWHTGDIVDRGPDSAACLDFVIKHFKGGVIGNHEDTILKAYWGRLFREVKGESVPKLRNQDKVRTLDGLSVKRVSYIVQLPALHVFDDVGLLLVHGGVLPGLDLAHQPPEILCRAQMINKKNPLDRIRWWGGDANKQPKLNKTEEENRADGYVRWYEAYDHEYDCIYGHSVIGLDPYLYKNKDSGTTIGIDTGSCFGGNLTALIYPSMEIAQVECKKYAGDKGIEQFKKMI